MSRRHCPLCQQAEEVVAAAAISSDIAWERIDIDSDAELLARYGWDVPVLLWRDRLIMQHHFDQQQLQQRLREL
ncbi:MAG: glutaredoxin family protein [Mariprofundales bacterium]|nr:glutaredoxin family protein [Mariprofundales bacterium]